MSDPEIRRRIAGRLLENESLTADLVDDAANVLLEWGLKQAMAIARQAEAIQAETLQARLHDLQQTMRHINQQAGSAAPEKQAQQVRDLLGEIDLAPGQLDERHPLPEIVEETHEA